MITVGERIAVLSVDRVPRRNEGTIGFSYRIKHCAIQHNMHQYCCSLGHFIIFERNGHLLACAHQSASSSDRSLYDRDISNTPVGSARSVA